MKSIFVKKIASFLAIFLIVSHFPVFAQNNVLGKYDCGQWIKDSRNRATYESWVAGYLSGLNNIDIDSLNKNWLAKLNTVNQAYVYLDNFCQKDPLNYVQTGLHELVYELIKKK